MTALKSVILIGLLVFTPLSMAGVMLGGGYVHTHNAASGVTASGAFTLTNTGNQPIEIKLFLEDAKQARSTRRSNRRWIRLSQNQVVIPARGKKTINYRIQTPKGHLQGSYWSHLIVQPVSKNSAAAEQQARFVPSKKQEVSVKILQVIRHAITIVSNFSKGDAKVIFSAPKMVRDAKTGKRVFSLMARNTGTAWVGKGVISKIDLYDKRGNFVGKFTGEQKGLFPGVSKRFAVDVSRLKIGKYKGLFSIAPIKGKMFGADVNIDIH